MASGERIVGDMNVQPVGKLEFGAGSIGKGELPANELDDICEELGEHTEEVTHPKTAGCGDGRETVSLADGTQGQALERRIEPQLFGGVGLAATKAAVAAGLPLVRGAKNIWEAYLIVSKHLQANGYEDGGHKSCGASATVKSSVEFDVPTEQLVPDVQLLAPGDNVASDLATITANKHALLASGFYDGWDPAAHEAHLTQTFPQNFAVLSAPHDHAQHGHEEVVVYAIDTPGLGFAKNAFVGATGKQAFGLTPWFGREIAPVMAETEEQQRLFLVALADDMLHVGGGLATKDMPVVATA